MNKNISYKILISLLFFNIGLNNNSYSQCGCSATDYGSINVSGWTVSQTGTQGSVWGGERITISNTVNGAVYRISTCDQSYDSQLSIYTAGCIYLGYNDDDGPGCTSSNRASIDITSPGGNLLAVLHQFDCNTNSTSTTITVTLISLPTTYVAEWVSMDLGSTDWCPGETRDIKVTIKNIGTATWTDAGPDVNIGCKWNTDGSNWTDYHVRTNAGSLAPGASREYTLTLDAKNATAGGPTYSTDLSAGSNNITFNVVKEGDCWFGNNNGSCGPGNTVYTSAAQTINTTSTPPTSITGTTPICQNASTTLTAVGGTAGAASDIYWYSGTCPTSMYTQEWDSQPYNLTNTTQNSVNGILNVTSTSGDPMIRMESIGSFDPTVYKYIQIRYKVTAGTAGSAQIFFTNTAYPGATALQYLQSALISDNAWHILTIDMSAHAKWTDSNIKGWRYDWCSADGVTMDLDYISLSSSIAIDHGSTADVSPSSTTTYYALRSGQCNTTSCASKSVTINTESTAPTSISSSTDNTCPGTTITLTPSGGTSGTGAVYRWFSGSCGGTDLGTGNTKDVSPTSSTTYYVRREGDCNTTTCVSKSITVKTESVAAASISASDNTICLGGSSDLSVAGGSLGTNATWEWYSASCGGTAVGTGTPITVSPTSSTTYYLRAEGDCNTTSCVSKTVTVNADPAITAATTQTICSGDNITLTSSVSGGADTMSYQWQYDNSGWTNMGTSSTQETGALTSSTLYRCVYSSTSSGCASATSNTVTLTIAVAPSGGTVSGGTTPICNGDATGIMTLSGHTGSIVKWQKQLDGGGWSDISNTTTTYSETPSSAGSWEYRAVVGSCTSANSSVKTIVVKALSTAPTLISANTNPICTGSSVTLTPNGGTNGVGAVFQWYSGSCGGTSLGTGNTKNVSPTSSTTYYVRRSGDCNTTACANATITVHAAAPVAPTATIATNILSTQLDANWNAVAQATTYYLDVSPNNTFSSYVSGFQDFNAGNVLTKAVTGLNVSTTYYYRVRASNTCGTSGNSNTISDMTVIQELGLFVAGNFTNSGTFTQENNDYITMTSSASSPYVIDGANGTYNNVNLIINGGLVTFTPSAEMINMMANTFIYNASTFTIESGKKYKNGNIIVRQNGTLNLSANSFFENSGDWTNYETVDANATSTVTFNGTTAQNVESGGDDFGNIVFNQAVQSDINLQDDMQISTSATFTSGIVQSNATNQEIIFNTSASSTVTSGIYPSPYNSFVNGPVKKIGVNDFTFPTGKIDGTEQEYRPIGIANVTASETFVAEYFYADPYAAIGIPLDPTIEHISEAEYWILNRTGANNANVVLSWNDSWSGSVTIMSDLVVARWNTSLWADEGNSIITGNITSGTITSDLVTSFSPFTLASKTNHNPLPIELIKFSANCENNITTINWTTTSEINNNFFTLERSADGNMFEMINTIAAAGNSNSIIEYSAVDLSPYETTYYRLKQTDFDGAFTYSNIISANCGNANFNVSGVYVNNENQDITVFVSLTENTNFNYQLYDYRGRQLLNDDLKVASDMNNFNIPIIDLAPGLYMIKLFAKNKIFSFKVVLD